MPNLPPPAVPSVVPSIPSGRSAGPSPTQAAVPAVAPFPNWVEVNCSISHLQAPNQSKCWRGPLGGANASDCTFENWGVDTVDTAKIGYVWVFMRAPGTAGHCYVHEGIKLIDYLKKNNRINSESEDWSGPIPVSNGYDAAFVITQDKAECRAFLRNGPVWQGGYLYIMRGYLCGRGGGKVSESDIRGLVAAVTIVR
jgi:hypothetical protein